MVDMSPWLDVLAKVGFPTALLIFVLFVLYKVAPKIKDWVESQIADQRRGREAAEARAEIAVTAQLAMQQHQAAEFARVLDKYNDSNEATTKELGKLAESGGLTARQVVEMVMHVKSLAESVQTLAGKTETRTLKRRQAGSQQDYH